MTVAELREALEACGDNDLVIMASDAEGNSHSPLYQLDEVTYVPNSTWSGSIYVRHLDDEARRQGYTEEDLYEGEDGIKAVVLCPTN